MDSAAKIDSQSFYSLLSPIYSLTRGEGGSAREQALGFRRQALGNNQTAHRAQAPSSPPPLLPRQSPGAKGSLKKVLRVKLEG